MRYNVVPSIAIYDERSHGSQESADSVRTILLTTQVSELRHTPLSHSHRHGQILDQKFNILIKYFLQNSYKTLFSVYFY